MARFEPDSRLLASGAPLTSASRGAARGPLAGALREIVSPRRHRAALGARALRAFTITEMLVVIAIVILILAVGLPAFSSMSIESRYSSTVQSLSGAVRSASIQARSDGRKAVALRLSPAAWDTDIGGDPGLDANRQRVTLFTERTRIEDPNAPQTVSFSSQFERLESGLELTLPPDLWAAPVEALSDTQSGASNILFGQFGAPATAFYTTWSGSNAFLDADDYTVVMDGATGVRRSLPASASGAGIPGVVDVQMRVNDPRSVTQTNLPRQVNVNRRFFTGFVLYRRDAFVSLGNDNLKGTAELRRDFLLRTGRPFFVEPGGGGLVSGSVGSQ